MFKRIFLTLFILAMIAAVFFSSSGTARADDVSLGNYAGIAAYTNIGSVSLDNLKSAFLMIEYEEDTYFVGTLDLSPYEDVYDPLVLVTADGWIVAFYPNTDPAGKIVDVLSKNLDETLLEKAVDIVAFAAGVTLAEDGISHYDFGNTDAANLLLVAEYEPDGNAFTLTTDTTLEKSYAFYRTFAPSFTLDNDTTEQVNFVLDNADYIGEGYYGSIYGHFSVIDFDPNIEYSFAVQAGDHLGFGALAILYNGTVPAFADADFSETIPLTLPGINPTFDLTPSDFIKLAITGLSLEPTLTWESSTAPNYEYCVDTSNDDSCDTGWISTGSNTSVELSNLLYETTYYWQVRAINSDAIVEADGGDWWSFTTADGVAPVAFTKDSTTLSEPTGSLSKVTMNWEDEPSYGAYYYEVCVDTTPDCIAPELWHNVGLATTATIGDLLLDTTYYWQVRAWNGFGETIGVEDPDYYTYADVGVWETFNTRVFSKLSPSVDEVHNLTLPFKWEETPIATQGYEYCIDTNNNGDCNTAWKKVADTSVVVKKLDPGTYYWQVRTFGSNIEANDGIWWEFEVLSKKDSRKINIFKESPVDGAVDQHTSVSLSWKSTGTQPKYEYCYFPVDDNDTTPISDDDLCSYSDANWVSVTNTSATTNELNNATTYYWQVRANLGTEEDPDWLYADKGDYWAFTTMSVP